MLTELLKMMEGVPILMPQAGNTMEEGTVLKWLVKVGEAIKPGQAICEIETDKATVEVEATAGGVVSWVAAEGSVVKVKEAIAVLGGGNRKPEAESQKHEVTMSGESSVVGVVAREGSGLPSGACGGGRVLGDASQIKASPLARKMALARGVDLARVRAGSGPGGRILSRDVELAVAEVAPVGRFATPQATARTQTGTEGRERAGATAGEVMSAGPMGGLSGGRRALSKMRKAIATNLQVSKQTVPHFYVRGTIEADALMAFYKAHKPATGCTLNDVVLLVVGRCVGEFAAFRSRIEGGEVVEIPAANIGVAVSVAEGLVVPVVLNVHAMTLGQVAAEARRVVEAARNGKIENIGKAVFSISNMGMLGVEDFAAIINPPESGILAIAAAREAVVVKDGAMRAGRVMSLTLSVDHRVVDGAVAAAFMARLKAILERPEVLL